MRWNILALWFMALPLTSHAHVTVLETQPPVGARLAEAPQEIRVKFSRAITPVSVTIVRDSGPPINATTTVFEGTELRVRLDSGLGAGTYRVSYRVTSSDGHPVAGTFEYHVVESTALESTTSTPSPQASISGADSQSMPDNLVLVKRAGALGVYERIVDRARQRALPRVARSSGEYRVADSPNGIPQCSGSDPAPGSSRGSRGMLSSVWCC